jgi:hypothetical protein
MPLSVPIGGIVGVDFLNNSTILIGLYVDKHTPAFREARDQLMPGLVLHIESQCAG